MRWSVVLLAVLAHATSAANAAPTGGAIPITQLPMAFNGSTGGQPNTVSSITSAACSNLTSVPGGEVIYTFRTGLPPSGIGGHIDFDLTPRGGPTPVIYVLATAGDGSSCVASHTTPMPGGVLTLHVEETLVANHDYYVYVDSATPGNSVFDLLAWVFIGVELQSFSID
ncbi:hypothetical protein ACQQ2N_01595 [Dokdonella sp. MW10]|uniref:hypothetical protein n=1 Tax=Dokdonella sp. MW10 TaxID=2992926 RepID=UPI003F7DFF69